MRFSPFNFARVPYRELHCPKTAVPKIKDTEVTTAMQKSFCICTWYMTNFYKHNILPSLLGFLFFCSILSTKSTLRKVMRNKFANILYCEIVLRMCTRNYSYLIRRKPLAIDIYKFRGIITVWKVFLPIINNIFFQDPHPAVITSMFAVSTNIYNYTLNNLSQIPSLHLAAV
jgi:hypothetical protein